MAEDRKEKLAMTKMVPGAIVVKIDNDEIRVATNSEENSILNAILASQGRSLIQQQIKMWKEKEATMSPKELRDLAGAMRDIAEFSAEVYKSNPKLVKNAANPQETDEPATLDMAKLVKPEPIPDVAPNDDSGVQANPPANS